MNPTTTQTFNEILKTIKENWGKGIVKELADYINAKEPTLKGFSDKNLWRMKQFYETYKGNEKLSALVRELPQETKNVFYEIYNMKNGENNDKPDHKSTRSAQTL